MRCLAETIRIEIPVNVVDNTGSGTSSVTRNLTAMERAFERADRAAQRFQRRSGVAAEIEIGADDNAPRFFLLLKMQQNRSTEKQHR